MADVRFSDEGVWIAEVAITDEWDTPARIVRVFDSRRDAVAWLPRMKRLLHGAVVTLDSEDGETVPDEPVWFS